MSEGWIGNGAHAREPPFRRKNAKAELPARSSFGHNFPHRSRTKPHIRYPPSQQRTSSKYIWHIYLHILPKQRKDCRSPKFPKYFFSPHRFGPIDWPARSNTSTSITDYECGESTHHYVVLRRHHHETLHRGHRNRSAPFDEQRQGHAQRRHICQYRLPAAVRLRAAPTAFHVA